jgi:hypothetical protein
MSRYVSSKWFKGKLMNKLMLLVVCFFRLQIGEEKLVLHIRELAEAAICWESKAEQALKHGESFDNCVKLIRLSRHSVSPLLMI